MFLVDEFISLSKIGVIIESVSLILSALPLSYEERDSDFFPIWSYRDK